MPRKKVVKKMPIHLKYSQFPPIGTILSVVDNNKKIFGEVVRYKTDYNWLTRETVEKYVVLWSDGTKTAQTSWNGKYHKLPKPKTEPARPRGCMPFSEIEYEIKKMRPRHLFKLSTIDGLVRVCAFVSYENKQIKYISISKSLLQGYIAAPNKVSLHRIKFIKNI